MSNSHLIIKSSLIAAVAFSLNVGANEHKEPSKDYIFSTQELNALSKANLTRLSDDQFVFNNDLALLDWDNIFASYFPHLQPYQETIMHYAGYYSINPKLLISIIESKSKLVTNPSSKGFNSPFGNLTGEKGFKAQIKKVASKLSKRFYAYKKLSLPSKKGSYVLRNYQMENSAATMAIASVLSPYKKSNIKVKNKIFESVRSKSLQLQKIESEDDILSVDVILDAYENIFAQRSDVLRQDNNQALMNKSALRQESSAKAVTMAAVSTPNLYLPWTSGWSWKASGGAHGFDGGTWPLSSLDFYYPQGNTGWGGNKPAVYASHGGTVTWYSRCNMRITHASGIATNYYHMDNLQYGSGSYVNAGTYIGSYANTKSASLCEGGSSTGPHLHISLLKNGYYESLQGYNFSGFYINVGSSQYDSNCSRSYLWKAGTTYCHGTNIYKPYE